MKQTIAILVALLLGALVLGQTTVGIDSNKDYGLEVSRGTIARSSTLNKFGVNPDIDTATGPEDVWDYDSVYTYQDIGEIYYISSSTTDFVDIEVQGLDSLWATQLDTVTTVGDTKTAIAGTKWARIFRARNIDTEEYAGTIYIYRDCGVTAGVPNIKANVGAVLNTVHQQTMMALYTIPAGKTGYLMSWYAGGAKLLPTNVVASVLLQTRVFGGVFNTQAGIEVSTSGGNFNLEYVLPRKYASKTDLRVRVQEVSINDSAISSGFTIMLADSL